MPSGPAAVSPSNSNSALSTLLGENMSSGLHFGSTVTGSPLLQSTRGAVGCLWMLKCVSVMTFKVSSSVCLRLPSSLLTEFSRVVLFSLITADIRLELDLVIYCPIWCRILGISVFWFGPQGCCTPLGESEVLTSACLLWWTSLI